MHKGKQVSAALFFCRKLLASYIRVGGCGARMGFSRQEASLVKQAACGDGVRETLPEAGAALRKPSKLPTGNSDLLCTASACLESTFFLYRENKVPQDR